MPVDGFAVLLADKPLHRLACVLHAIGVIVDLADTGVDGLGIVGIGDACAAMHDERGLGELPDLSEDVEVQTGITLVDSVYRPEGAGEDIEAG